MNEEQFTTTAHCLKNFPEKRKGIVSSIKKFLYEKFEIYDAFDIFPYSWMMFYYEHLKPIVNPCNQRIRKFIPRKYCDITSLITDINFEFIKAFYEDEYIDGIVDWSADEPHKEFAKWLEESYLYIIKERPELEKQKENAYPKHDGDFFDRFEKFTDENGKVFYKMIHDDTPYEVKYSEVIRLENLIDEKDTEILTQLIKRRNYFWT